VVFHLASSYPYQAVFREVYERVMGVGRPPTPATAENRGPKPTYNGTTVGGR
jgi:hypothetical protein